jgi:uncharacterized membrane protein YjjP (DUF1212 family)
MMILYFPCRTETCLAISEMILTSGSPDGRVMEAVPNLITRIGFDTVIFVNATGL